MLWETPSQTNWKKTDALKAHLELWAWWKSTAAAFWSSHMLGGEMWNSETISFSFISRITRARKQVSGMFKNTHSVFSDVWEICIYVLNGKRLTGGAWLGVSSSWLWWWAMIVTDLEVWSAQCCWLSVSRCSTEALDSAGKWVRSPTGRKHILDFF